MDRRIRHRTRGLFCVAALAGFLAAAAWSGPNDAKIDEEIRFAEGLIGELRLPDYATKVLDALTNQYPEAKAKVSAVRISSLTSRGKFDDAEKMIAAMPAASVETMGMKLALADAYYVWGKLSKAKEIYDAFFQSYTNGPPPELKDMYGRSADKYSQMLLQKDDIKGALQASRYFLMSGPEPEIADQCKAQMAELCVKLGTAAEAADRKKYFDEAKKYCEEILWKGRGDLPFAKSVVSLAHIYVEDGKKEQARKLITDYLPMLKDIDKFLREEKISLKYSPMAECRYILAGILEEEGKALLEKGSEKEALGKLSPALSHYMTVYVQYPESNWADGAGKKSDDLRAYLKGKGYKVPDPDVKTTKTVMEAQIRDAHDQFRDGNFKQAKEAFLELLQKYPEISNLVLPMNELAQSCIRDGDDLYGQAIVGHIGERFSNDKLATVDGGKALLQIASVYEEETKTNLVPWVYNLFFDHYPNHDQVPLMLFRMGENYFRKDNHTDAMVYYQRIAKDYTNAAICPEALSRLAACQVALGDPTNAAITLATYVARLTPNAEQAHAMMRQGDALRTSGQTVPALNKYIELTAAMSKEPARWSPTPDDAIRNSKTLARAMFWKAFCYSKLKEPKDKVAGYQLKAIETYSEMLKAFPKAQLKELGIGPAILSSLGTLYFIQNNAAEAEKAYKQLEKDYPDSPEAQNVLFTRGKSLLEIGQTEKATQVFGEMIKNAKAFKPYQFKEAGRYLLDAKEYDTAAQFFTLARASDERGLWEPSSVWLGEALVAQGKFKDAVPPLEELFKKYPNTGYYIEANLSLSRACAEVGQTEADAKAKDEYFRKAMAAMKVVKSRSKEPEMQGRADIELAKIQMLMGEKNKAMATYQRMLMFGDTKNPKMRPFLDTALENYVPLLIEQKSFDEVMETCGSYLKAFPDGRMANPARQWRTQMKMKGVKETPIGGAGEAEIQMDAGATNAPAEATSAAPAAPAPAAGADAAAAPKPAEAAPAEAAPSAATTTGEAPVKPVPATVKPAATNAPAIPKAAAPAAKPAAATPAKAPAPAAPKPAAPAKAEAPAAGAAK